MTRTTLALCVALAACGGKKAEPPRPIDVAAINALVPAALKDKVVFEQRTFELKLGKHGTTYTVALPKTWKQQSEMFGNFKGDDKAGFMSAMTVGSNCNGECKEKDWAAESDKADFAPLAKGKIIKDEKAPGRRTMIASAGEDMMKTTTVVTAWWTDGAKNYHHCRAELDDAIKDAAPAFEKACAIVNVDGDD